MDFEPTRAKIAAKENGQDPEQAAMCAISGIPFDDVAAASARLEQLGAEQLAQLKATAALFPDALVESELGKIPAGWEPTTLNNLLELAYGKALKKTDRIDGPYPVYGSGGINGTHNSALVDGPGIIVGRKGTVGSLYWEDSNFYPIDTVFYVKPKADYSLEYLFYLLQTLGLESMNTDAAVPGLNRNNAYRLEVLGVPEAVLARFTETVCDIRNMLTSNKNENESLSLVRDTLLPKLLSGEREVTTTE